MPTYANALTAASDGTDTNAYIFRHDVETAAGNTYEARVTLTASSAADAGIIIGAQPGSTDRTDLSGYLVLFETDDDLLTIDRARDGIIADDRVTDSMPWGNHTGEELVVELDYRDSDPDAVAVRIEDANGSELASVSLTDSDPFDWGGIGFYRFHAGSDWYLDRVTPPAETISVASRPYQNVTRESLTLAGNLTNAGGYPEIDVWFDYRSVGESEWHQTATQTVSSTGRFTAQAAGLTPGGEYEYRVRAAVVDGTVDAASSPRTFRTLATNVFENWDSGADSLSEYIGDTGQFSVVSSNPHNGEYALTSDAAHGRILNYASGDGPLRPGTYVQSFYPVHEDGDILMVHFGVQSHDTSAMRYAAVADHSNGLLRFGSNIDGWSYVDTEFDPTGTAHQYNDIVIDWGDSDLSNERVTIEYRDPDGDVISGAELDVPLDAQVGDAAVELSNALHGGGWAYSLWTDADDTDPDYRVDFFRVLGAGQAGYPPQNLTVENERQHEVTVSWDPPERGQVAEYVVYTDGTEATRVPGDAIEATISGLDAATTYSITVSALDSDGVESPQSAPQSATTIDAALTVETGVPTNVTTDGATFRGTLTAVEASSADVRIDFRLLGASSWTPSVELTRTEPGDFESDISGLDPSTIYEVRAVAADTEGNTDTGDIQQFETEGTPWDITGPATRLNETGTVEQRFPAADGTGEGYFEPNTEYEYRAIATDPARGVTSRGTIRTVTTGGSDTDPTWTTIEDFGHRNIEGWYTGDVGDYAISDYWATSEGVSVYNRMDRAGMIWTDSLDREPQAGETIRFDLYSSHGTADLANTLRHRFRFGMTATDAFYDVYIDLYRQEILAAERSGSSFVTLATGACDPIIGEQPFYGEVEWDADGRFSVEYFGESGGSLSDRITGDPSAHDASDGTIGLVHHSRHLDAGQTAALRTDTIRVRED